MNIISISLKIAFSLFFVTSFASAENDSDIVDIRYLAICRSKSLQSYPLNAKARVELISRYSIQDGFSKVDLGKVATPKIDTIRSISESDWYYLTPRGETGKVQENIFNNARLTYVWNEPPITNFDPPQIGEESAKLILGNCQKERTIYSTRPIVQTPAPLRNFTKEISASISSSIIDQFKTFSNCDQCRDRKLKIGQLSYISKNASDITGVADLTFQLQSPDDKSWSDISLRYWFYHDAKSKETWPHDWSTYGGFKSENIFAWEDEIDVPIILVETGYQPIGDQGSPSSHIYLLQFRSDKTPVIATFEIEGNGC